MPGTIVFSHANGFPAGTYRVLFDAWRAAGHTVHAIERLGHDPQHPVTNNWPKLREQLAAFVESHAATPVFLVGHSLGGMLSLMVACRRPALVRGVVLLDAPVVAGWRAHSLHMAKVTGLMRRMSPSKVSSRRRHEWPTREAVHAHFASKTAFARWDPRVLADYVHAGFDDADGRIVLGFRREIESTIYDTLPHNFGTMLARHPLRCPFGFIAGRQSVEVRQAGLARTRALARERFEWIEGSHLFPFERPDETAAVVARLLQTMG